MKIKHEEQLLDGILCLLYSTSFLIFTKFIGELVTILDKL